MTALPFTPKPFAVLPARPVQPRGLTSPNADVRAYQTILANAESDTARSLVFAIIKRIEAHLDEETAALEKSVDFDFKTSNDRKSQGLVDLSQAMRRLRKADINSDCKARVAAFRKKLDKNLATIRVHMNAANEIATLLSDAIQRSDSDGTYSRRNPYRNAP